MALFLANPVLADSPYNGIWQLDTQPAEYYSLTVSGDNVTLISLSEVARFQDPLRGAYFGMASPDVAKASNALFYVHLKKQGTQDYFFSWTILLSSTSFGLLVRPSEDYPGNLGLGALPTPPFRKIF